MTLKTQDTPGATGSVREEVEFIDGFGGDDAAASSLLKKWGTPAEEPVVEEDEEPEYEPEEDGEAEETAEEEPEGEPEEDPEEGEETEEDPKEPKAKAADDDAVTEVKVGDKVHKVTVKDLKRLFGQEQALTQKSQEVAQAREAAEAQFTRAATSLEKQIERAKARADGLLKINIPLLARDPRVSDEEIRAIMADQEAARADVAFFEAELDDLVKGRTAGHEKVRTQEFQRQAVEAKKVLTDETSPLHIPNFDRAYQSVLEYGVRQGIPPQAMANEINPVAINVLYKAMKYDAGQAALKAKGKKATPVVKAGSKTVAKPGSSAPASGNTGVKKALNTLRETGSDEAAARYLLRRWGAEGD